VRRTVPALVALVALLAPACGRSSAPPECDPTGTPTSEPSASVTPSRPDVSDSRSDALPTELDSIVPTGGPTSYGDYTTITDDSEALAMDVPVAWSDVNGRATDLGPGLSASPDLTAFKAGWDTSGVIFIASCDVGTDLDALLEQYAYDACTQGEPNDYSDGEYTGRSQLATDCGDTSTGTVTIAALKNDDEGLAVLVFVQLSEAADQEALERIQRSFRVIGEDTSAA
jgi:hypothetical protein